MVSAADIDINLVVKKNGGPGSLIHGQCDITNGDIQLYLGSIAEGATHNNLDFIDKFANSVAHEVLHVIIAEEIQREKIKLSFPHTCMEWGVRMTLGDKLDEFTFVPYAFKDGAVSAAKEIIPKVKKIMRYQFKLTMIFFFTFMIILFAFIIKSLLR